MARTFAPSKPGNKRASISAYFPLSDMSGKALLSGARLEFEQYSHDVYVLMYVGELNHFNDSLRTGTPVHLTIESEYGSTVLLAYVHHIGVTTGDPVHGHTVSTLYCVGSSYPLKQLGNDTWVNKSVSQMVKEIARRFSFAADVDDSFDYVISSYLQANRSYWEVLRELAVEYGALLKVEGTTLRFLRPVKATQRWSTSAPLLTRVPSRENLASVAGTPFTDFTLLSGQLMTGDHSWQSNKVLTGVDVSTGRMFTSTNTADGLSRTSDTISPFDHLMSLPSSSMQEAQALAQGAANRDRHPNSATVTSTGNPFVVSDKPVFLQGVGASDGIWTVKKAHHDIGAYGSYTMILELGSDGLGTSVDDAGKVVTPEVYHTRDSGTDYVHNSVEVFDNHYLHQASILPVSGKTGSQYVTAQWKNRDA